MKLLYGLFTSQPEKLSEQTLANRLGRSLVHGLGLSTRRQNSPMPEFKLNARPTMFEEEILCSEESSIERSTTTLRKKKAFTLDKVLKDESNKDETV